MQKIYLLLLSSVFVTGCAIPLQNSGMNGGYIEAPGPGKLEQVTFSGIVYIEPGRVLANVNYRVAEIAKSKNKPYFLMYRTLSDAALGLPASSSIVGWMGMKPTASVFALYLDESQPGALKTSTVLAELHSIVHPNFANLGKGGAK
ncbi:hypothetical protein [Undibacterium sp. Tian12W]|uniref:hypothetical protein n=1 Tax=Undibacterium sp. Tian12W TaxID=3413054 RepID=UPI003BF2DFB2